MVKRILQLILEEVFIMQKNLRPVDFVMLMTLSWLFYNYCKFILEFYMLILMFIMVMESNKLFIYPTELCVFLSISMDKIFFQEQVELIKLANMMENIIL